MNYCAEQISDDEVKQLNEDYISLFQFAKAAELFPHNTPHSKEAFYMRRIFHEFFPSQNAAMTVRKWIPKWQANQDPSGKTWSKVLSCPFLGRASLAHDQSLHKEVKHVERIIDAQRPQHA